MNTAISILAALLILVPSGYALAQGIFPAALLAQYPPAASGGSGAVGTNFWPLTWGSGSMNSGSFSLGNQFIVGATNITVSALTRYTASGNTQAHSVGLYNLAGTLLASNTITATNPTANVTMVIAITPVVLSAHTTNMVVSQENADQFINNWTVTTNGCATLAGDYYGSSSTLIYPSSFNALGCYPAGFVYQ